VPARFDVPIGGVQALRDSEARASLRTKLAAMEATLVSQEQALLEGLRRAGWTVTPPGGDDGEDAQVIAFGDVS